MEKIDQLEDKWCLCHVEDCEKNADGICTVNADFDNELCNRLRKIENRKICKNYNRIFSSEECIEVSLGSVSKGSQRKWITRDNKYFIKECFYYQLRYWNDDLVEILASSVAGQFGIYALEQWSGCINGIDCSYAEFWGDKKFIPFGRLKDSDEVFEYKSPIDRIHFIADKMYQEYNRDFMKYLLSMAFIDFIVGNEDRHLYNFGVLWSKSGVEVAPLFDFGLGLFEHDIDYHGRRLEECISRMSKKPFGGWESIIKHFDLSDIIDQVNVIKVKRDLLPNPLALEYLQYSLGFIGKELLLCD